MEELVGPEVEVILTLKEVNDLSFVTSPVFLMATLLENQMETDVHEPDTVVKFNTDLVWETNKSNIKRMRNNNIPIKLSLFKLINQNQKEKFGYVVLNLRTAQYVPRGKQVKVVEDYVKVLGLGKEAKGCSPHLLMSLRIQDKMEDKVGGFPQGNFVFSEGPNLTSPKEETIEVPTKQENPIKYEGGDGQAIDDELISWKLSGVKSSPRSPRTKHSITSSCNEKRACLTSYDKKNSSGDLQPQKKYVQAYHNYKLEISLRNITWLKVPPKFNFRFHQSRAEVTSTAHPEITIERANEEVELCDIKANFIFAETPSEFFKLLSTIPPIVSISSNVQNRPVIIARGILEPGKLICDGDETLHTIDFVEVKSHEVLGRLCYSASLTDCGPQVMKDVTLKLKPASAVEEGDLPPVFFDTVTDKIVDELEEWKERQKDIFQQKFASKLKSEIQELRAEWMERKRELEEKLNEKMEQCRQLGSSLITATEDVKQKNRECLEKEKKLEATKSELEVRYLKLLTDKKEEAEKLRTELQDRDAKVAKMEEERNELEKTIKNLRIENEQLKEAVRASEVELERIKRSCLSQEQTATLLQDLKTMQEKLETANNSKLFFKEQWGRAVREIHRIKSEYSKNIQVQLQYRKDELKKLGLEQLYLNEKNKNNLERDDLLEAKDFLGSDFDVKSTISDAEFPYKCKGSYESFKTNMDIVRESNSYLLKNNQENEERLKKLIEERDKLLCDGFCQIDDERVIKLNKEIRHLLEH